ncbi:hypothetical protein AB0G34_08370 [Kitasatospora aureofaciens]|uniref:hypothetical protein n=1 Tax=Kitasatospora aureofaciens TaxID=1894 RepID=UPI001782834E|nr:hypothetical protein [Kitasatospora aureofaciens]
MLIDRTLRAILTNSRRGPEALVLQGSPPSSSSSPEAPWDNFSVSTYLDVNYPTQTSNQYEFQIRGFFREHPVFVVKAFDRHERAFPFAAARCVDDFYDDDHRHHEDGDRDDHARPHDGVAADGGGPSGAPSPEGGDQGHNGQPAPETSTSGGTSLSPPPGGETFGESIGRLGAKRIGIASGGLLMVLGALAAAWLRRRRRKRATRPEQGPAAPPTPDGASDQEPEVPPAQP